MVAPFPEPGRHLTQAHRELHIAATGTPDQVNALGDLRLLPRPWDPPTCTNPELRHDLWQWLEHVVDWLNTQTVWDPAGVIPDCWPHHPHLVHDIAVLADQRRRASNALTSDPLEEWHRYALPAFDERTRTRLKSHCDEGHQTCPAKGRHARHVSEPATTDRAHAFKADVDTVHRGRPRTEPGPLRPHVVDDRRSGDTNTGEITDTGEVLDE